MKYTWIALLLLLGISCDNADSDTDLPAADFSEYTLTDLANSPLQKATKTLTDGTLAEEGFVWKGQKTGTWTVYYPDGKIQTSTQYLHGLKDGLYLSFNDRCQIQEQGHYAQDQLHGRYTKYRHGNRREEEAHYKHGVLDGVFQSFDKLGKVQREIHYKDGQLHGPNIFFTDGEKTMEYEYKDGEKVSGGIVK